MPTMRWTSMILTIAGCRHPPTWTSGTKKTLYKMYTCLVLILAQSLMLSAILDIVFNVRNQTDFGENLYMTAPMMIACCKLCTLWTNSESIMILMTATREKPYLPMDDKERKIETKFDSVNERLSTFYTVSTELFMLLTWTTSLFRDPKKRVLAFRAWIPYDYSTLGLYSITYAHQAVSLIISSLAIVAFDCLFSGLIFCICSQLDILGHRLQNIKDDAISARDCARHHNFIYAFAMMVNEDFQIALFAQFFGSMVIICYSLFRITQSGLGEEMIETLIYALCFLMQIFYYCWYGNEVKLKSLKIADLIFASNWVGFSRNTKKTLLMIMIKSAYPIEFSSAHVLSVNLETFMMVIKTSYSTYNLLQESNSTS